MFELRLKNLRTNKGITQAELAKHLDVTQQAVGRWEKAITSPDYPTLLKLAAYFNVTTDYLLGLSDQPQGHQTDSPAAARPQPPLQPDTLTPEEASLIQAYRNANDRDKSIVDTILKPEVRAQSEAVEETPLSTAQAHTKARPIIRESAG